MVAHLVLYPYSQSSGQFLFMYAIELIKRYIIINREFVD